MDALAKPENADYLNEYIPTIILNELAWPVKRADLQDNLDMTWLPEVSDDVCDRIQTYHQALKQLDNGE